MTHATLATADTGTARSTLVRRRAVAGALTASSAIAAAAMLARPLAADDWHDYAAFSAERDATWIFSVLVGLATGAAFLTLGLAACLLVRRRGAAAGHRCSAAHRARRARLRVRASSPAVP